MRVVIGRQIVVAIREILLIPDRKGGIQRLTPPRLVKINIFQIIDRIDQTFLCERQTVAVIELDDVIRAVARENHVFHGSFIGIVLNAMYPDFQQVFNAAVAGVNRVIQDVSGRRLNVQLRINPCHFGGIAGQKSEFGAVEAENCLV